MIKDLNILNFFWVGFEFEFLSNYNALSLQKKYEKEVKRKLFISMRVAKNKKEIFHQINFKPTKDVFVLTKDHSGDEIRNGKFIQMTELITGPIPYSEARIILIKTLNFIQKYGWTNDKSGLHINISYNSPYRNDKDMILNLDLLKFCLDFDENLIYKYFPERRNNVYAQSIKNIIPNNPFIFSSELNTIDKSSFILPNTKYFGINFQKRQKNYLEFRYLGGANYEKRIKQTLDLIDHFMFSIYDSYKEKDFSEKDKIELNKIIKKHNKIVQSFSDYKLFRYNFPNIKLFYDLKDDNNILETFYMSVLRQELYNLIVFNHMEKGMVNYDSDLSRVQIKDSELINCTKLDNYEIINSKVIGIATKSDFYKCEIESSNLEDCNINYGTYVKTTKMINTNISEKTNLIDCYIENRNKEINGNLKNCIIRYGSVGTNANLENTILLSKNKYIESSKDKKEHDAFDLETFILLKD